MTILNSLLSPGSTPNQGINTTDSPRFAGLGIDGTTTLSGAAVVKTNLNVEGTTTLSGAAIVKGLLTIAGQVTTTNNGTPNTGITAVENGNSVRHTTVLTVNTTLPAIAGGAALSVGKLLYTLPAGAIVINNIYMSIAITQTQGNINANTPDVGLGTTIGSGANALLSAVGSAAENILTGQTAANCTGTATVLTAHTPLVISSADDHTVYLNAAASWAASGDAAALLTGTVTIDWSFMA